MAKIYRTFKNNIKHWFQKQIRGWSDNETWNLDYEFIKWINSRFKRYKEVASNIVDLEFHKFKYKRKEYTQLELINKIIELSDEIINEDIWFSYDTTTCKKKEKNKNEIFEIFKLIFWSMWW